MSFTTRTFTSLAVVGLVSIAMSTRTLALEGSWQVGINAGLSLLSPETSGSGFTLDEDQSTAVGLNIGLDLSPIISAELAFTDLGEASLSDNQTIGYQAISLGATAYILGEKEADWRADGASVYARLGFSSISNEAEIDLDESDNIALWLGLGIQYPFSDNWGMRAEIASFDGDAQALMAGIFWRAGTSSQNDNSPLAGSVFVPVQPIEPAAPEPSANQESSPTPVPEPSTPATPEAQLANITDPVCPPDVAAKVADLQACAVLNGIVPGLDFAGNTAELTPNATAALDRVAAAMKDHPAVVLEIRAHTQPFSNPQAEAQLTSLRARAVARYLVQNGVPVGQLRAKAFGATQPLSDSAAGNEQDKSDRIELRIL